MEKIILDNDQIKNDMYDLMKELFPICRSITGDGLRQTLKILQKHIDLTLHEVPTDTKVFDWIIPKEWNIKDAYILDPNGKKIVDFQNSNLHVLNYSIPIKKQVTLDELKSHLYTLPEHPDFIPYRTSYYEENWGFCISHNQYESLENGEYEVCIDSTLQNGHLTYGEFVIKGEIDDEILISCYVCHPSMCNDNLSGVILTTFLAKQLQNKKPHYTYRFLFVPETIGSITWLARNKTTSKKIKYGLVATCTGDQGKLTYKKSKFGDAKIDRVVEYVLKKSGDDYTISDFFPLGSDERQFCSPGINLPVGVLSRTRFARFPEYHTSADNLDFVKKEKLFDTFEKYLSILTIIEHDRYYINLNPFCEPQLGKRGLYQMIGGLRNDGDKIDETSLLWILSFSDGNHSLLDIAEKSNFDFHQLKHASDILCKNNLLKLSENS